MLLPVCVNPFITCYHSFTYVGYSCGVPYSSHFWFSWHWWNQNTEHATFDYLQCHICQLQHKWYELFTSLFSLQSLPRWLPGVAEWNQIPWTVRTEQSCLPVGARGMCVHTHICIVWVPRYFGNHTDVLLQS